MAEEERISNGEYQALTRPIIFEGKSRVDAKRRALDHWYRKWREGGLSLRQFLECCRLQADERQIAFYPPEPLTP